MKKFFKVFFSDIEKQEVWLNEMTNKGLRLVKTSNLFYYFEESQSKFLYKVEWAVNKSDDELNEYIAFLKELGINSFRKNFALGGIFYKKRKFDPLSGKTRKSPGNINSELLILEKVNDGKPFEIYTTTDDKISYLKKIRLYYLAYELFLLIMLPLLLLNEPRAGFIESALFMAIFKNLILIIAIFVILLLMISIIKLTTQIRTLKKLKY